METILVTGGAGFIGSNIAEALVARGHRVVVLDDLSSGALDNIDRLLHHKNFNFVRGSILDSGLLRSIMKTYNVAAISHQAAVRSVTRSILEPVQSIQANITGTANLFDIAAESCCRRVVFASSWAVYGDVSEEPRKEHMQLSPASPYAVTKVTKEMLARNFCTLHNIEIVGLRYFSVYGRRQNDCSDYAGVIPRFITKALRNEPLPVEGDGLQTRDFVYIADVVQANMLGLTEKNISGQCFNIGSGSSISILDLAKTIIGKAESQSAIIHCAARVGDVKNCVADIQKAKTDLHYTPAFNIDAGLTEAIEWYRNRAGVRDEAGRSGTASQPGR